MIKDIIKKIRFFHVKRKESYFALSEILGFLPGRISIYETSLTHKSSATEDEKGRLLNNERLEFLGDSILDSIIADIVYNKFENEDEGFLTNTRSKIVKREMLDHIAVELNIDKLIVFSSKINTQKSHILGNALEALIGAIYLDKGYEKTKKFVLKKIIVPFIDVDKISKQEINFKSRLLEWGQHNKSSIEFDVIESFMDIDNNPVFQTQVMIDNVVSGVGIGNSKKESQQNAAMIALRKIEGYAEK